MSDLTKVDKICKIASNWWANAIEHPKMDNGDYSREGRALNLISTIMVQLITIEQQKQFNEELYNEIKNILKNYNENQSLYLSVDYSPDKYLSEPAKKCNISLNNFPIKTTMVITKHSVKVRYGYSAGFEILYADKYYWQEKINNCKKTIEHYQKQDNSYFESWTDWSKMDCIKEQEDLLQNYQLQLKYCEE